MTYKEIRLTHAQWVTMFATLAHGRRTFSCLAIAQRHPALFQRLARRLA